MTDVVLIVASIALVLVAWATFRTLQTPAEPARRARPSPPRAQPSQRPGPPPSARPPAPPARPAEIESVPSLVQAEEEVEITVVEAAPLTEPPARPDAAAAEGARPDVSRVEVMYEDEAGEEELTLPVPRILVSAQGQSDRGRVRKRNEDNLLVFPERSLFCVADGMGGYHGGDVASAVAVETMRAVFEWGHFDARTRSDVDVPRRGRELACAIQLANQAVYNRARSDPALAQMGTTLVAARFSPNKQRLYIGHVGDSRCYRLRDSTLRQLTRDHTMAVLTGLKGPGAHHLFQAVGIGSTVLIDLIVDRPRIDDVYLLCSDGLPKMVEDAEIQEVLMRGPTLAASVETLIGLANAHGGKDNSTVILVKVTEPASRA